MRNRPFWYLLIAALALAIWLPAASAQVSTTEALPPLIRLHVLAESDSAEDQALKLRVRDAVLTETDRLLSDCDTYAKAYRALDERLADVQAAATRVSEGVTVQTELTTEIYPDRCYAETVLPAGEYTSLKITLGQGDGRNWWCIVYPGLCCPARIEAMPAFADEEPMRFLLWELLSAWWERI